MQSRTLNTVHSVPSVPSVPDFLAERDAVTIAVDPDVPFIVFADAIVRAGLVIRGDGRGGILISKGEQV